MKAVSPCMVRRLFGPRTLVAAVAVLSLAASAAEPSPDAHDLAGIPDREARNGSFSGVVLVERDGRVLLRRGWGLANAEHEIPNDPEGIFLIGSLTKQFTAAGILLLVQEGTLSLDDRACRFLEACPDAWRVITIRHLLQCTSGIVDLVRLADFPASITLPTTLEKTYGRLAREPLSSRPGETYSYSNSGFLIAALIIERVSGKSYEGFMASRLFEPLGMTHSGYAFHERILSRRAAGYARRDGRLEHASYIDMSIPAGAGSDYSTLNDLLLWHRALRAGPVLDAASRRVMFEPGPGGYALGWDVSTRDGKRIAEHIGDINGYGSYILRGIDDDFLVVVLANLERAPVKKIATDLRDALLGTGSAGGKR